MVGPRVLISLLALALRAKEASRKVPRIQDENAGEIVAALGVDFDGLARELGLVMRCYNRFLSHEAVVVRTIMFRETLHGLIERYPDAACVNLGCGLDDKFMQVDNEDIEWFDVDLPDQIALRRRFFKDRPRCTMVCGDALDGAWTTCVSAGRMVVVCMEGVLEYFTKDQTAVCLHVLCDSFEHGYLVAEMNPMAMVEYARQAPTKESVAPFRWGTASGEEFVELEPRLALLSEHSLCEEMRKHTLLGMLYAESPNCSLNNRIAVFRW